MTPFKVWAPHARTVDIEVSGGLHRMARIEEGWWFTELSLFETHADYAFVLDGGQSLPDPRSPWQPDGIHGRSRLVAHDDFPWTDQHWQAPPLAAAIVYEVHIGTFTPEGTFDAAIDKLDHLVDLGITHVELMPVAEFSGSRGWGYDGADLYAPHHAYGGPDGLKRLVDACHRLAKALRQVFVYDGRYSSFRRRRHGRPPAGLPGFSFLGYLQNHDQIGNRAKGERSGHLMSLARSKIAAALVMTAPFVPMLFQGEEWGASSPFLYFTDHEDAELGRAVTEGRRREFAAFDAHGEDVPDPQAPDTFERSKLIWIEREQEPHAGLLNWHRQLIALRRKLPDLSDGRLERIEVSFDEESKWMIVRRGRAAVVCNLANSAQRIPLGIGHDPQIHLASHEVQLVGEDIELPADSVAILTAAAPITPSTVEI